MSSPEGAEPDAAPETLIDPDAEFDNLQEAARRIAALSPGEAVPREVMQDGLAALIKLYTLHHQMGDVFSPFGNRHGMPATCIMVTATELLRAVNIEPFELGFWQAVSQE